MRRSLNDMEIAAAEFEVRNWRIREEIDLMLVANIFSDQLIQDRLAELESDPLMRNAFERLHAQNLEERNNINVNQAQPFQDDDAAAAADDRRE